MSKTKGCPACEKGGDRDHTYECHETRTPASQAWISVEDRMPEDGQYVWYFFEVTGVNYGKYEAHTGTFYGPRGFLCGDVTHWMPAPEPPCFDGLENDQRR